MDAPTPTPIPAAPTAPGAAIPPAAAPHGVPAPDGVAPYGGAQYGTAQYGTAQYATAQYGGAQYGVAPAAQAPVWTPPAAAPQNALAWVSLGLGLASLMFGLLASIAAVICGHIARRQIRERGDQGAAAALIGLIFGYVLSGLIIVGLVLYVLFLLAFVGLGVASQSGVSTSL
ncbi:DUF4190 domain-containing protein [Agromyces sp. Leaf222]|uniref:DUF4190 domain-containing protein n=1 Tax=Agromyces sp. Leaf222 TaxID=1735688 RepID=UPI0006FEE026|nr:DUF4190 domain-containing protein [Agromyces sp. Leaf222]KQM82326.1 hypothetical protein ASE68_02720 [Agromyces sp. Leaf222]